MKVLNVGGGASRDLPSFYRGWDQILLDIDPAVKPDIVCDAKNLGTIKDKFDAVFNSHNLEHFYRHDVPVVLRGFVHVLKPTGFAQIAVPDMETLFEAIRGRDIMDTYYTCNGGPISFHDVIYGWNKPMSQGNLFYSHKCGFTEKSISKALISAGFKKVFTATENGNLHAYAFKSSPTKTQLTRLGI